MERLVFFGDSNTYGWGLDLAWDKEYLGPNPNGWAALLCNRRGLPGENYSTPGASNLEILWRLRMSELQPSDHVVVQWSFWTRDCILDNAITQIRAESHGSHDYFKVHCDIDMQRRSALSIEHGHLLLTNRRIPHTFLMNDPADAIDCGVAHLIAGYYNSVYTDWAEDGIHAGYQSNVDWACQVDKLIEISK